MEKKGTIISLIVLAVIIASVVALIFLMGIIPNKYNYIQFEVNPKVEFICDKHFNVVSYAPLNHDGEIVLCNTDYKGKKIDEVAQLFLDECAKTGYLDINGIDNAINITVLDGITQALDSHVTESVYKYFIDNEVMGVVVENYEDRKMFDKKKENQICCANKYKLVKTMSEQDEYPNFDELKNKNEVTLIDMVAKKHQENPYTQSTELKNKKEELINTNKGKYNKHKQSITPSSQKEFNSLFEDFQKLSGKKYFENFEKEYYNWQQKKNVISN